MLVDGTGVCKVMSKEASALIKEYTTYKERIIIALNNGFSITLVDKIVNGQRQYTVKNSLLVVALFQKAIANKNKQKIA